MLDRSAYFIREHAGLMKLTDTYDILDPESQEHLATAREEPAEIVKYLRLLVSKKLMPTKVNVYPGQGKSGPLFSIVRGVMFFSSKVDVIGPDGSSLGFFKSKVFSLGGGFDVYDPAGTKVAQVKGNWKGWNFEFLAADGSKMGTVTKKWAGMGKELFTSADNYMISLTNPAPGMAILLLAAGLAIDTVFKEKD